MLRYSLLPLFVSACVPGIGTGDYEPAALGPDAGTLVLLGGGAGNRNTPAVFAMMGERVAAPKLVIVPTAFGQGATPFGQGATPTPGRWKVPKQRLARRT